MRPFAKKSLGQHWLTDRQTLQAIVKAADIQPEDTVLEVGPGPGDLTALLLDKSKRVIAVELDQKLADALPKNANLEVIKQDILRFDFTSLPSNYKVVANIPYYLTGKLLQLLSETANPPTRAVLLIQKEVAERVAAQPGDMSILSVITQYYWQVRLGQIVPARLFTPPPKVDSQLLILDRRAGPLFDVNEKDFFWLVKLGFAQPRKTLLNNLASGLHYGREEAQAVFDRASLNSRRRPQTLHLEEWHQLYQALHA